MREPLLTIEEAADQVRLSVETLRYLRKENRGPKSGKLGRRVFYRQSDLDAWVNAQFEKSEA
jgi:excisionase family DNA binding protein